MAREKVKSIELSADSDLEFFMIHGYSGSPTDFYNLPYLLHEKFNANVKVILLKGHGTKVEDLDDISYEYLISELSYELEKDISKGRKIILCGVSMGGMFSLILSSKFNVEGVINVSTPYFFKFPFNIPGLEILGKFKKYWLKSKKTKDEELLREGSFSYTHMHKNGLIITKQAKKYLDTKIQDIKCPILTIHSTTDHIGHHKSIKAINEKVGSRLKKETLFTIKEHNIFYSGDNNLASDNIIEFIEQDLLNKNVLKKEKVAAIIPAYNEGQRIENVLKVLIDTPSLDEIIVFDDGSTDDTENIVSKFEKVKYLKNPKNIGKADSMERGVSETDAEIIFFCDADLVRITPEIVEKIIEPVRNGSYAMFIGLRENFMQNSVHLFAINSGERALRREVWEKLPKYFKYKYRVEAGLNYYVKKYFGGFGFKTFPYSQTLKENKYGFLKGTYLRWSMNLDVLYVYVRESIESIFRI